MSRISEHHEKLSEQGEGKCSVPMFSDESPSGFCDKPAYGTRPHSTERMNYSAGRMMRDDGKYNGYVPALACPCHGGPDSRVYMDGDQHCAVWPDFLNLQESPAGFGDTPEQARAALSKASIDKDAK